MPQEWPNATGQLAVLTITCLGSLANVALSIEISLVAGVQNTLGQSLKSKSSKRQESALTLIEQSCGLMGKSTRYTDLSRRTQLVRDLCSRKPFIDRRLDPTVLLRALCCRLIPRHHQTTSPAKQDLGHGGVLIFSALQNNVVKKNQLVTSLGLNCQTATC